ncbi:MULTISPECIES: murein hydrolase activator EnvC family protein [unclassified Campylobacter]|uniref:murein hydrolase activator EnvC family protein n=1 Tax=unclassified Campylobacter TaxID=2593542 RepID=UPI001237C1BA|nr:MULTISPECIES: M23 family metallopeptidase [unclassified Campylobacter]KAA6224712.1 peptidoglycan DD-metalloendopeptidase family protein [Campylobacter sp. LR185c]KAA6225710.1 peptidoglycan DD-metalloendopeptidase family protein [Campylobacter sp. LR286c]KAA6225830.1 peptidoglycan DD-metalloendopeptidase family protein [Campylobacter sp. LR196d]KAA6229683.1 peptidoglycan DD-metalloendopeptidase family protein [Campylobacter sp. LR291e]KAA6230071.1 peptidoglycan DD-metalloendopeptidase family
MRIIFCFLLALSVLFSSTIKEKTKNLEANKKSQEQLNKKLEDLAVEILNGEKALKEINSQIQDLNLQISKLESNAKVQNKELDNLANQNKELLKNRTLMENKLVSLIAKDFAYDLPIPQGYIESEESFIALEVLQGIDMMLNDEISKLSKDYDGLSKMIDNKQEQIKKINLSLKDYNEQVNKFNELKKKQLNVINKQKMDRDIYTKKLENLSAQQNEIRKTLNQLKIIEKQNSKTNAKDSKISSNDSQKIRQIGSSYQGSNVKKYTGKKTIAPLESFVVKQKFGNYVDPIYNIKIFNENVILRSKKSDATVKSVLDGKIVFAKDTGMLERVVIIEHSNGIHTIYAHLDKIAPTVKVGKNIKKGAVVGRIKDDLTFEVTQKNFHINPLELISLN